MKEKSKGKKRLNEYCIKSNSYPLRTKNADGVKFYAKPGSFKPFWEEFRVPKLTQ